MTIKLGYARISTDRDEGGKEQTLGQQIDSLTNYGVSPADIYSEKISGKINIAEGAAWIKLQAIAITATDQVEIVLVDWSRLSRDGLALQNAVMTLSLANCVFTIIGDSRYQKYAPKDAMDGMFLAFEAFGAQMHRERISKATKSKLDYLKSQGIILGRPRKLTDADLITVEQLRVDGWGAERIALELTKRRIAAITLETKANQALYVKALKHARVAKSTIAPILKENVEKLDPR